MNPNLETFKKFNQLGIRRKYALTKKRLDKFRYNNEWEADPSGSVFTLRDYKCCYITIMKNKTGQYEPKVNGSSVSLYPDIITLPKEYGSVEEAKNSAILFVDSVTKKNK